AGVQGVLLVQVLRQGCIGVSPGAEVVKSASDLLSPLAAGMGVKREIGVRLGRLAAWPFGGLVRGRFLGRIHFGHGNDLQKLVAVFTGSVGTNDRPHTLDCTAVRGSRQGSNWK